MSIRRVVLAFKDKLEVTLGLRNNLTPPKRIVNINDGDAQKIGQEFLHHFINVGQLRPTDIVLDVGCGFGRMAAPLTMYLTKITRYEGFDIIPKGVEWCKNNISPKNTNFNFQLVDVYSERYNPTGKLSSSQFNFPFADGIFDFVFLTSVFTHMLPADVENYTSEISRVLKPGGKCFITWFVLNQDAEQHIEQNKSEFTFRHTQNACFIEDPNKPEYAIAYNEEYIQTLFEKHGLKLNLPIHYGSWCGRSEYLSFQDIVVAVKD